MDARLLVHVREAEVVSVAQILIRAEGRISASAMRRLKEQVDGLVAAGKLEKVEGGYRRKGG